MSTAKDSTRTVAVTGATGLLGRHLCDYFRSKEWAVHAMVRDVAMYPFAEKDIQLYKCILPDIIDISAIESADVLIHCAYMTRYTNLDEARLVNEEGTAKLYETARVCGVKQFVFVSSRAARANAQSNYARSKYELELSMDHSRDLIIRPGLVLASEGGLFQRIIKQITRLPVIPLFGGGNQQLNTIHIEDLCKVFEWALENRICGVVTAADPEGISMKDLLRAVMEQLGQRKMFVSVPATPFVILLQLLEYLKLKLPVSSENLRGLMNRDNTDVPIEDKLKKSGIKIRTARECIKNLVS